jgi:hypothetical protein
MYTHISQEVETFRCESIDVPSLSQTSWDTRVSAKSYDSDSEPRESLNSYDCYICMSVS